ncbi:hypothetical protein Sros_4789 [Streptosporangium roseum DSM 43021]|uniref:Uncharacterized protein n=1 Tax=Streptosporangium roseum (strain ATCC 12428 / DSM 43021 / JCM 3005 / KCTC 9067 / NCIMB 10171 / NRRL 2505 / NI 9100) TaxID=479432 RepID=D2B593_STRRD|nr:hypothetical protein Sros_4789 [Streptosporangium roseum DSM 43021]
MPLTSPGSSASTLVSDIRWIFGSYYRAPYLAPMLHTSPRQTGGP